MSWRDRPYSNPEKPGWSDGGGLGGASLRLGLPRPTRGALTIIGLCFVVLLLTGLQGPDFKALANALSLQSSLPWQLWRLITFQFVHANASHFLWNMLGLYFLGCELERAWGTRRFLAFYLTCGVVGGLFFLLMTTLWSGTNSRELVGASGGVLGCLMGCAILFPQMRMIFIPIRLVTLFVVLLYVLNIITAGGNWLGDVAHMGGIVAASVWVLAGQHRGSLRWPRKASRLNPTSGRWKKMMDKRARQQQEIDRILDKIHQKGIISLTRKEKRILKQATEEQRAEDARIGRL